MRSGFMFFNLLWKKWLVFIYIIGYKNFILNKCIVWPTWIFISRFFLLINFMILARRKSSIHRQYPDQVLLTCLQFPSHSIEFLEGELNLFHILLGCLIKIIRWTFATRDGLIQTNMIWRVAYCFTNAVYAGFDLLAELTSPLFFLTTNFACCYLHFQQCFCNQPA